MRLRPASSRLRFSCSVGLSVFVVGAGVLLTFVPPAAADPSPDAAVAAPPDELVLDLGGATVETRKVPHGVFTMGSVAGEPGHDKDEEPAHQVTITKDFWIGKYPVTRGQFAKFVADTRYVTDAEKGQAGGSGWEGKQADGGKALGLVRRKDFTWRNPGFTQTDTHPVVLVSYGDATAFVGWASRKSGKRVRLPTEAEWEFAARAGTNTAWSGGPAAGNDPSSYGWFKPNAGNGTRPVGQKKPNALGIFDMSGDVMEWCRDVYAPYREGAVVDPETTTVSGNEAERRVLRGGSWFRDPKRGRSSARYRHAPGSRVADIGFRVVVTNEEAVAPAVTSPGADFVPGAPLGLGGTAAAPSASGAGPATSPKASGPLADGEALRVDAVGPGSEPFSWGLLLISPLAAASAVVAWMLLRRKRSPAAARAQAQRAGAGAGGRAGAGAGAGARARADARAGAGAGVSTRSGADGFFVSAPGVMPGARVRYACIVNGTEVSDVVPLDGEKETFVFTGSPPTAIRVLEIVAGARAGAGAGARASAPPLPQRSPPPVPVRPVPPPAPTVPMPPVSAPSSTDLPVSVEVMMLPDAVQTVTEKMVMPGAPPPPPSVPAAPPSVPRAPPSVPRAPPSVPRAPPSVPAAPPSVPRAPSSVPRPPPSSPRALIVPVLEPEEIRDATSASGGASVDVLASTDVDLSSSRDVALAATKVAAAAPAMTAAQAFKVEPLEAEATKEAPKDEAPKDEAPKVETTKDEAPKVEAPKDEAPKDEAPKVEAPKVETTKDEATKDEAPKDEAPKVEATKDEAPKDEAPKVEATKDEAPKNDDAENDAPKDDASTADASKAEPPKLDADGADSAPSPSSEPAK